MSDTIRIGTLGAAQITEQGLVRPASELDGVSVAAIAARDRERAQQYASRFDIPRVYDDYQALLDAPDIDAVYVPLPKSRHRRWTLAALRAGKHVLCEKPMAANAREAKEMARTADECGLVLAEAVHYRYHPMAARIEELVVSGALGEIEHIRACMRVPVPQENIRRSYELAGGSIMDPGCYPLQMLRHFGRERPEIVEARARTAETDDALDVEASARFRYASGATGEMEASIDHDGLQIELEIRGTRGRLFANNPVLPHLFNELRVDLGAGEQSEVVAGPPTFTSQLRAFAAWVRDGVAMPTDAWDAVRNMAFIDDTYRAAGLPVRGEPSVLKRRSK